MKINELLVEGPLDFVKKFVPGTAAHTVRQAAGVEKARTKHLTKGALQKWAKYTQNLKTAGKIASPSDAVTWFSSFSNTPVEQLTAPTSVEPSVFNTWLEQRIGDYLAKKTTGKASTATATPTIPAVQPVKPTATIGALGKRSSTAPAAPYQSPLGVTIRDASDAGITLLYKNRNFMLNNRGEWSVDGKDTAGATASGQLAAEMDKVAKSTGYME
jgi:hypothetical protein